MSQQASSFVVLREMAHRSRSHRFNSLLSTVVGPQSGYERYEKARKDADAAEEKYKREVIILDRLR